MPSDYEAKPFIPNRADIGKMVGDAELARRLGHELQIPQRYGLRLLKAYRKVVTDALEHGEGMNLDVVTLRLTEFDTRNYNKGFLIDKPRAMMYRYVLSLTDHGESVLKQLTKDNFK